MPGLAAAVAVLPAEPQPAAPTLRLVSDTGSSIYAATTWNSWNSITLDTAATGGLTSVTWGAWNLQTYATGDTSAATWGNWNVYLTTGGLTAATTQLTTAAPMNIYSTTWGTWVDVEISAEERARRATASQEREAKRSVIGKRAEALLLSVLDDEQRATWEKDRFIDVYSGDRKRRYRIRRGWSGNVELIGADGKAIERYCVHPRDYVPEEDNVVAQKLMIEHEEERFRKTANITRLRAA